MTTVHLRTFAAGAAFTLLCVAGSSIAAQAPASHGIGTAAISALPASSGPSTTDKLAALTRRVDALQNRQALDHANLHAVALAAQDAASVTGCIDGALYIAFDASGNATADDGTGQPVATIDPSCLSDAP